MKWSIDRPALVLVDVGSPTARNVIDYIHEQSVATSVRRLVLINVEEASGDLLAWAAAYPDGCVTKHAPLEELLLLLERVTEGEVVFSATAAPLLLGGVGDNLASVRTMTLRERQIAELIKRGYSNKDIARELTIELSTVKNHVHRIFTKAGISRRAELQASAFFG